MECLAVQRAAGDAVDGGVDEAERVAGLLVGQGDQPGPERRGGAGAAGPDELVAVAWRTERERHAGSARGVRGDVRHAHGGADATTIRRLRAKLGDPPVIQTVRESGYRIGGT